MVSRHSALGIVRFQVSKLVPDNNTKHHASGKILFYFTTLTKLCKFIFKSITIALVVTRLMLQFGRCAVFEPPHLFPLLGDASRSDYLPSCGENEQPLFVDQWLLCGYLLDGSPRDERRKRSTTASVYIKLMLYNRFISTPL